MSNEVVTRLRATGERAMLDGARHLGDVVTYDAERIRIPRADLRAAFESEGFGEYVPSEIEARSALSRAAGKPVPRDIILEAFVRPNKDTPHAIGVYKKEPGSDESGDKFVCGARVRVAAGDTVIALSPEGGFSEPSCFEVAERIARDARELLTFAETTDVTSAAIAVLTGPLSAIPMRKRGGVYFLRPAAGEAWQRLAAKLLPFGFVDLSYPMADDQRSTKATGHMVKASLESDLAALRKELAGLNDKTRESTVERRVADCDALVAKSELYADILGGWLDQLRADSAALKSSFAKSLDKDADVFDFPKADEPVAAE
jgi:hypothetical protein